MNPDPCPGRRVLVIGIKVADAVFVGGKAVAVGENEITLGASVLEAITVGVIKC